VELVETLRTRLREVRDPELQASIVDLGMVGDITVDADGVARVEVALTMAAPFGARLNATCAPLRSVSKG